ncbi:DUF7660 family protein [Undibacterium fentianense]|uniref:DUF7660 domain-containing protein n=1 Tax=Undibacterium fentianense TaxID=2828728 RepID=A0A941II50_9BURK|nr:hypothetical protein [Undibacterium fentianense]MBR7801600.1 hypothetical protein [Undibacterium fentianense]
MTKDLFELVNLVDSEESFIYFLGCIAQDWHDSERKEVEAPSSLYGPTHNGWENGTIGSYLEAAATWAEASKNGLEFYKKPDNPWRRAAEILYMGKIYE